MNDIGLNALLEQMRLLSNEAKSTLTRPAVDRNQIPFTELLKQSIDKVNGLQQHARHLTEAFEHGEPRVSLAEVMIAGQKASISFQALTQVRNHMLSAYQEIMKMSV